MQYKILSSKEKAGRNRISIIWRKLNFLNEIKLIFKNIEMIEKHFFLKYFLKCYLVILGLLSIIKIVLHLSSVLSEGHDKWSDIFE